MAKLNDVVFIDKFNQFGRVSEIDEHGTVTKVKVTNDKGNIKEIITTELIVILIGFFEQLILNIIKHRRNKKAAKQNIAAVKSLVYVPEY